MPADRDTIITENLRTLEGECLLPCKKQDMAPGTRYLVLSFGGAGGDVLEALKKRLKTELTESDFYRKMRFLAIDTDINARFRHVEQRDPATGQIVIRDEERFAPGEFLWLDGSAARANVDNNTLDGAETWLDPRLLGEIRADKKYLDGNGTCAVRQVGRLLFTAQPNRDSFRKKILRLVHDLTDDNGDNLEILIVTSIAGGTGGGIVIDATYLIRSYIESIPALTYRARYSGFVLLPPTGKSSRLTDAEWHSRNGYAALKEIDWYMTLTRNGKTYDQIFGSDRILVEKNLFDVCYLIDGCISGMAVGSAADLAAETVCECAAALITSSSAPGAADILLAETAAYARNLQESNPPRLVPRDANYVYCALGHGQTLIPLDLMKGYVARRIFDRMYAHFRNCSTVEPGDVEHFLSSIGCPNDNVMYKPLTGAYTLTRNINAALEQIFRSVDGSRGGPYYTVNLLRKALGETERRIMALRSRVLAANKEIRLEILGNVRERLLEMNRTCYEVYCLVLDQLHRHMDAAWRSAVDWNGAAPSGCIRPLVDFNSTDSGSRAVRTYLDRLADSFRPQRFCQELVSEMASNRAAWTNLYGRGTAADRFDAAREIRRFLRWVTEKLTDITLENTLVKYCTGDPDAGVQKMPDGTLSAQAQRGLELAARDLVQQMFSPAATGPSACFNYDTYPPSVLTPQRFVMIPNTAPNLKKAVREELLPQYPGLPFGISVIESISEQRVTCFARYAGVSAYMLAWTRRGEESYEHQIFSAGLHQTADSADADWLSRPNLMNRTIWPLLNGNYTNAREAAIAGRVSRLFDRAADFGLAVSHAVDGMGKYNYYELRLLCDELLPDPGLYRAMDGHAPGSPAWEAAAAAVNAAVTEKARMLLEKAGLTAAPAARDGMARALLDSGTAAFVNYAIRPRNQVWTAGAEKPDGWDEDLAKKLLRKDMDAVRRLRSTLGVMETVYRSLGGE